MRPAACQRKTTPRRRAQPAPPLDNLPDAERVVPLIPSAPVFEDNARVMISSIGPNAPMSLLNAPVQGMKRGLEEAAGAAQKIAEGDISPDNFTALLQAGIEIKANRTVAVTADKLIGSLLDRKS